MRNSTHFLMFFFCGIVLCGGAAKADDLKHGNTDKRYVVTYYDRNHDGIVDYELHELPGGNDTDWALSDTKFRGRYDLKIKSGLVGTEDAVDLEVPKNVKITPGNPPGYSTQ